MENITFESLQQLNESYMNLYLLYGPEQAKKIIDQIQELNKEIFK